MGAGCRLWLAVAAAASLTACAVGPDYQTPLIDLPTHYGGVAQTAATPNAAAGHKLERWWRTLGDRELNSLIDRAVASNLDIEIALARVQQARTQEVAIVGLMLPTVAGSAGGALGSGTDTTKGRVAQSIRAGDSASGLKQVNRIAGFDAGWELDFFGKYLRQLEAAKYDADAQWALRNAVTITVIADVVRNYINLRGFQFRLQIARNDIAAAQKTLDVVMTRFMRGLTNELDVALAKRQLATQQARVPDIEGAISAAESNLAVLLGTYASELAPELKWTGSFPRIPARLRLGLPVDLLRSRPDIQAAERTLAAANARIGMATADLFPSIALSAGLGAQGGTHSGTATPIHNPIWSFGPGAYWPLLDFGRLDALIDIEELRTREQLANYKKTIIVAVEEVDQAVKQYRAQTQREQDLTEALADSRRAVDLANERYERGVTDFLNVLDAQRQEYELEDEQAVAEGTVALQYVVFYKALGNGWEP